MGTVQRRQDQHCTNDSGRTTLNWFRSGGTHNTTTIGRSAERAAEAFLKRQGLKLVSRNFHSKRGEIDLIMECDSLLVFVEVRLRHHGGYGSGADSVDQRKQQKIIFTAKAFLQQQKRPLWQNYRFDVISMAEEITWIKNAFTLD